jgi:streptogramin lyase
MGGNSMARGVLLFGALVLFTLLYALVLQWLSESSDNAATQPVAASHATQPLAPPLTTQAAAQVATGTSPVQRVAAAEPFRTLDDGAVAGQAGFIYSGAWQHIVNQHDGRSGGTSSRTYHIGAKATFDFSGDRLKIFGVKGPNGGYAELRIDGETYGLLRFYAPHKEAGALVYASPALPAGHHIVEIVVAESPNGLPKRRFVNLDGAAFAGP